MERLVAASILVIAALKLNEFQVHFLACILVLFKCFNQGFAIEGNKYEAGK